LVLVVEHPRDVVAFERTGRWKGTYHVLLGRLSPHEGAGTEALSLKALEARVARAASGKSFSEPIPTPKAMRTALAIEGRLGGKVAVSRLARGLSSGGAIEYAGTEVLAEALRLRRPAVGGG
jgi:recombination protein RecR